MESSAQSSKLEPLRGEHSTDIAIIGGGYTGLWSALFLTELDPAIEVSLLEQEFVGYGGSGRNGGILDEALDHSHQLAIAHFGTNEAHKLARYGEENVEEMVAFLTRNRVDCDLERTGRLFVALTPRQIDELHYSLKIAEEMGISKIRNLNMDEVRSELDSPLYLGGAIVPGGGILNPVKLVNGLKRIALERRVKIYENSKVLGFDDGRIRTQTGSLGANRIILATDAYTHFLFPQLLRYYIPLYDYILVSEPLTTGQHERIRWQNRQGVTDGRSFFNYYRLTADNRILWGTSEAKYYRPNRVDEGCDHSEEHYSMLRQSFRLHFPKLKELQFPYAWGGPIASTTRFTPFFGSLQKGRIVYALGYTGHGLGSTRIAGKILAHLAVGKSHELLELSMVRKKPFPFPPEPLRSAAIRKVTRLLRKVDAGDNPGFILRVLDRMGIGLSS
jgi:glycine/D-amino acid oxidase-like deaminating enzyme